MAFVTYFQGPAICTVPGSFGFLSAMWLMYGVMAAVHSQPWFALAWAHLKRQGPKARRMRQETCPGALTHNAE